jgi:hypothetical protein
MRLVPTYTSIHAHQRTGPHVPNHAIVLNGEVTPGIAPQDTQITVLCCSHGVAYKSSDIV